MHKARRRTKQHLLVAGSPIHIGNTTSIPALAWTIGALTLIAFLALLIVALGFGRRGKKNAAPVNAGQGYPAPMMQGVPMQPGPPIQQNNGFVPSAPNVPQAYNNGLAAFGAPMSPPVQPYPGQQAVVRQQPAPGPITPAPQVISGQQQAPSSDASGVLHPWPCGHLNRSTARFCSICGEPAPPPSASSTFIRRFEQ